MTAPERIYLQGAADAPDCEDPNSGVTWCWHQIDDTDVEYVRADIAARATAEQRSLGDVTGAMYRCRRCGETSEIQFNYATLPKEEVCCRQQPCIRPGNGPCDMPARDTKLSATHQSLLVRLAALKRYRNKLKSTGEPSGNYATLSVPIVLLEDIDAAIESQRSGDGS